MRFAVISLCLLAGCPDRSMSELSPKPDNVEHKTFPLDLNRDLDLLFMIDDSSSMTSKQQHLKDNFPTFIDVLQHIIGGLPSVHIGVVSSDLGDGGFAGCAPGDGDDGRLQSTPHPDPGQTCTGPTDRYIVDVANPDGTRTTNYDTSQGLASTFTCIAALGASGCGFEHQLGSVARALDPSNAFDAGFLRPDAFLGIVFVTDEDDCTASDPALYDPSNASLGPLASFRCTRYGIRCDQDTNAIGAKSNCVADDDGPYLADIDQQVAAIKALKADPDDHIAVAAIMAPPTPVEVIAAPSTETDPGSPFLAPSCDASFGHGDPAVRMDYFLGQFTRHTETSVCEDSYQDGLQQIAQLFRETLGDPCMQGDLKDFDPATPGIQPDCTVAEVAPDETQTILPACDATHSVTPCWYFQTDTMHCGSTPTQLSLSIDYGATATPLSDHIDAQCVIN